MHSYGRKFLCHLDKIPGNMIARSYGKTRLDFYKQRFKQSLAMDVPFRNSINNKSKSSVRYHILVSGSY